VCGKVAGFGAVGLLGTRTVLRSCLRDIIALILFPVNFLDSVVLFAALRRLIILLLCGSDNHLNHDFCKRAEKRILVSATFAGTAKAYRHVQTKNRRRIPVRLCELYF